VLIAQGAITRPPGKIELPGFAQRGANAGRSGEILRRENVAKREQRQKMAPGGRHLSMINQGDKPRLMKSLPTGCA
jgi:hypothetical protein